MWKVEYTRRFLKELSRLPKDTQSRVESIVFSELKLTNPFELGYLKKMKGYKDKYKIRVGDYRVGLTLDKKSQTMICQRVAHRLRRLLGVNLHTQNAPREIYQIFP